MKKRKNYVSKLPSQPTSYDRLVNQGQDPLTSGHLPSTARVDAINRITHSLHTLRPAYGNKLLANSQPDTKELG